MSGFLDSILKLGNDKTVSTSDPGQKGKGFFTSDFISSAINAALGIYGIYQDQQMQNQLLQQQSAQADDANARYEQELALKEKALEQQMELGMAGVEAQKQATLMGAYRNYLESIGGARQDTQRGYHNLSEAMTAPLNYLIGRR